jgi:hypothetical protein
MADDERQAPRDDDRSLELPSLRSAFRRRRRPPETAMAAAPVEPEVGPAVEPPAEPAVEPPAEPPAQPGARRVRRSHLALPGPLVALVTGAVVGLALVGLTSASLHLCSSVRGTSSCGKPGILLLLVITGAMVLLGSLLLRVAGVSAHGSTSFLGVGLLVVLIQLALLPVLDDWWVVIVIPVIAMLTYAAAWWLTTTYVDPGERAR